MPIDWFTVGAQTLNFLILVWLMKRFLYQPILNAIDGRERRIAAQLAEAVAKETAANTERDVFRKRSEAFDQERTALLGKATDEAKLLSERLLERARQAADALTTLRAEELQREQADLHEQIARRTQDEVFAIARKTLSDLAGASLEERIAEVFTQRLRMLRGETKDTLARAIASSPQPTLVRSAFNLATAQRKLIQDALNETFSADLPLRFEAGPDLIGGIELRAHGQKVTWNISDYLTAMELSVGAHESSELDLHSQRESRQFNGAARP